MEISSLILTQCDLRDWDMIEEMSYFVSQGGFFTQKSLNEWTIKNIGKKTDRSLIQISIFEDGKCYIHDGHHRAVGTFLGGRDNFREDEYEITEWKYEDYLDINFENNWLTPFDPRSEMRVPDFFDFKERVWDTYNNQSIQHAYHLIKTRNDLYKAKRMFFNIGELLDGYRQTI